MKFSRMFLLMICLPFSLEALAKPNKIKKADDILGKYKIIGRETLETRAIVAIRKDKKNQYFFQLVSLNKDAKGYTDICSNCRGKFKNKKLKGMIIAWNLKASKNNPHKYSGAFGLDPWTGKMFNGRVSLQGSNNNILYLVASPPEAKFLNRKMRWLRVN